VTLIELPPGRRLVLASASPRRSELLGLVGLEFDIVPADIDESSRLGETPADYVARLSAEKARVVADRVGGGAVVVAADTTVDIDGQILEKPDDDADARRMLRLLSGRTHLVHTGVTTLSLWVGSEKTGFEETVRSDETLSFRVGSGKIGFDATAVVETVVVETAVRFVELSETAIDWYLSTGEHLGKAGAYGIQGAAGAFVERIDGSVTNVIGLPLAETLAQIERSVHP
jgi:septum formation protein